MRRALLIIIVGLLLAPAAWAEPVVEPCATGSALDCITKIGGYTIPSISGKSGGEQHCAINEEQDLEYCAATKKHYANTKVTDSALKNGIAFSSTCQLGSQQKSDLEKQRYENLMLYGWNDYEDLILYGWNGGKPECYTGYYVYSGYTDDACDPLPIGKCAMTSGKVDVNEEINYLAMRWASGTFARTQKVFVRNTVDNICAVTVPLEYGPSSGTGKVAGFSPELNSLTKNDDDSYNFSWLTDPKIAPGIVPCDTSTAPTLTSPINDVIFNINEAIQLSWKYDGPATSYNIEINIVGGNTTVFNSATNYFDFPVNLFPEGGQISWKVQAITDEYTSNWSATNTFMIISEVGSEIDFSQAGLAGITIDLVTNTVHFILDATAAALGAPTIDVNAKANLLKKTFLAALAIPNNKQWISLDVLQNSEGIYYGSARAEAPFEQTDLARYFFESDVEMKFDLFTEPIIGSTKDEGTSADWVNLIKASPYYSELSSQGFNSYPYWLLRATIIPDVVESSSNDSSILFSNTKIKLDRKIITIGIDLSPYNLSAAAETDVKTRLETYKTFMQQRLDNGAAEVEALINGDDPAYQDLRDIFPMVAAAQWYKTLNFPFKPYEDLIDSEDLIDIYANPAFDKNYWDGQAWQYLDTEEWTNFDGAQWTGEVWGGVVLDDLPLTDTSLTTEQTDLLEQVVLEDTVQLGETYYLDGGSLAVSLPDLSASNLSISTEDPTPGDTVAINAVVNNFSNEPSGSFTVKFYDRGVFIGEQTVASLSAWGTTTVTNNWAPIEVSEEHNLSVVLDAADAVSEFSEENNEFATTVEVFSNYPTVTIVSPEQYSVVPQTAFTLVGYGKDTKEYYLHDNAMQWTSDIDGVIGSDGEATVSNPSLGKHIITLTATNSRGYSSSEQVTMFVVPENTPAVTILSPVIGQTLAAELSYDFEAVAQDLTDGDLCAVVYEDESTAVQWQSDIDGELGNNCIFERNLSVGTHTITFTATNSAGISDSKSIAVNVASSLPTVTIDEIVQPDVVPSVDPTEADNYYVNETITLEGTGTDPQDGALTDTLYWYSDIDGYLGEGPSITTSLSEGDHTITLVAYDYTALQSEISTTITVSPPNFPPTLSLILPQTGAVIDQGLVVSLQAQASDQEDGNLSGNIIWSSDRDGTLGTGSALEINTLSLGTHQITASITDSAGISTSTSSTIIIQAPDSVLLTTFSDGSSTQTLEFPAGGGDQTAWVTLPENIDVVNAQMTVTGQLSDQWEQEYMGYMNGENSPMYTSGRMKSHLEFVDIDGDTDFDLFMGDDDGTLYFYRNNGTATSPTWIFISDHYEDIDVGNYDISAPTFTDIDGDNDYDLFIGDEYGNINFYRNDGTSTIPSWTIVTTWYENIDVGSDNEPAFVDIDGDNDQDLFIGNENGNLYFYRNDGIYTSPSFTYVTNLYESIDVGRFAVPSFTDIDTDGDPDLFIGNVDGNLYFYRNDGTATSPTWTYVSNKYENIDSGYYSDPTFADIDADDDQDLFIGNYDSGVYFYRNDGIPTSPAWSFITNQFQYIDVGLFSTPAFTDIDGDNDFDLFMGDVDGTLYFYRNDGTSSSPNWVFVTDNYINAQNYSTPTFVDIDGDDDQDLFIGDVYGKLHYYRNDGTAVSPNWTFITNQYNAIDTFSYSAPTFIDIDGDTDYDLFVGSNTIYYYRNDGTATSPTWTFVTDQYEAIDTGSRNHPVFIDIDNDSDFDLFVGNHSGTIYFYRNDGTTTSPNWTFITDQYQNIIVEYGNKPAFIDIDNDNDPDLFFGEYHGGLNFYRNISSYPTNPTLDVSGNGTIEWSAAGEFTTTETTPDFSSELNSFVAAESEGNVPLLFHSDTAGKIELANLDIQYLQYEPAPNPTDTTPPVITASAAQPNPATEGDTVTITVQASDDSGIQSVVATWLEQTAALTWNESSNAYEASFLANQTGISNATITVTDTNGLTITSSLIINVQPVTSGSTPAPEIDTTTPEITAVILPEIIYEGGEISLSVGATDNIGLASVSAELNSASYPLTYNAETVFYETVWPAPPAGDYTLTITATDVNGLYTTATRALTIEPVAANVVLDPFSLVITPEPISEGDTVTINLTMSNAGGTAAPSVPITLSIDDAAVATNVVDLAAGDSVKTTFSWAATFGEHNLTINSSDSADVIIQPLIVFDTLAPAAPTITASPASWTNQSDSVMAREIEPGLWESYAIVTNFIVTWPAVSDNRGIAEYKYRLDQGEWVSVGTNTSPTVSVISDGQHLLEVVAVDNAANISDTATTYLYRDVDEPAAPVLTEHHSGTDWTDHDSPYLTWENPGDEGSGVAGYEVLLDGSSIDLGNVTSYHPTLTSGEHNFQLRAYDELSQYSDWSNTITVKIDLDAPATSTTGFGTEPEPIALTISSSTHPDQTAIYANNTPAFSWTEPTDAAGISGYYYLFDQTPTSEPDKFSFWQTETTLTVSALPTMSAEAQIIPDGTWYLHVAAKDKVGNLGEAAHYQINIDTTEEDSLSLLNCLTAVSSTNNPNCWLKGTTKIVGTTTITNLPESVMLQGTATQEAYAQQDITTGAITGKYIVVVAKASAETVRSTAGSITGLPYLKGVLIQDGRGIVSYLNNTNLRFNKTAGEWDILSAMFPVSQTSTSIRLWWKQARSYGESYDGSKAWFEDTGVFIVDSQAEADEIIAWYQL